MQNHHPKRLFLDMTLAIVEFENLVRGLSRFHVYIFDVADNLLVSTGEAYKSLHSLNTRKVPGPDDIPNLILKTFSFKLAPVFANIYNSSLRDAYVPPLLKTPVVTPIPKQSDPTPLKIVSDPSPSPVRLLNRWKVSPDNYAAHC